MLFRSLGFIVLSGEASYEGHEEFMAWRKGFCGDGRPTRSTAERSYTRRLKSAFSPAHLQAFYLTSVEHLDSAVAAGQVRIAAQGRQPSGQARKPKLHLHFPRASSAEGLLLAEHPCGSRA